MVVVTSKLKFITKIFSSILFTLIFTLTFACSAPRYDDGDTLSKQAILDAVQIALTNKDCITAIQLIDPLYESDRTDNEVRLARASAYGCAATIDFFGLLGELTAGISGTSFWAMMAQNFPETSDSVLEATYQSTDALMSIINEGVVVAESNKINQTTDTKVSYNVGSIYVGDRSDDSNFYLIFVSMAMLGVIETRNGDPNPAGSYGKTKDMPWTTVAAMTTEGCAYASAMLNLIDASEQMMDDLGLLKTVIEALLYGEAGGPALKTSVNAACVQGCTDCGITCSECPRNLRSRSTCDSTDATDTEACAAVGIINHLINDDTNPMTWLDG